MRYFANRDIISKLVYRENEDGSISKASNINNEWRESSFEDAEDLLGPGEEDLKNGRMVELPEWEAELVLSLD